MPGSYPLLVLASFDAPESVSTVGPGAGTGSAEQASPVGVSKDDDSQNATPALFPWYDLGPTYFKERGYAHTIAEIQERIRAGLTYQVNYTIPIERSFSGNPEALFHDWRKTYPSSYACFADLGDYQFLSVSPELFFLRSESPRSAGSSETSAQAHILEVRPMKGTAPRGADAAEDERLRHTLLNSDKDRAELAMITDLLRNDLGRIAPFGSVQLESALELQSFSYVHQLISRIKARLSHASMRRIIPSLFPSGSVTGAPRKETMKIIAQLESGTYRGIYTGAMGYGTSEKIQCNVAIRTASIHAGKLRYGAGSGITIDSDASLEWQELLWKARPALVEKPGLIETMLLRNGTVRNADRHMRRLERSAKKFSIPFSSKDWHRALDGCPGWGQYRLRIHLTKDGLESTCTPMPEATIEKRGCKVILASRPMNSRDPWLLHKVDRRGIYNGLLDWARSQGYDEALLFNERKEITEGCISNIFYQLDGRWFTPPIRCGLLPGVGRQKLLDRFGKHIGTRKLLLSELPELQRLLLVSSLRGVREATI